LEGEWIKKNNDARKEKGLWSTVSTSKLLSFWEEKKPEKPKSEVPRAWT
jgi:preprotein translocase subunit Sec61beta